MTEAKKKLIAATAVAAALIIVLVVFLITGSGRETHEIPDDALMTVTALNCGSADAFVLMSDGRAAVIDCGERDDSGKIISLLQENGIESIDFIMISHFDKDHVGGAAAVIKAFDVGEVYVTYISKDNDETDAFLAACDSKGIVPTTVTEETRITFAGSTVDIYPPEKDDYGSKNTSNNSSLCAMLDVSGHRMFFTGDAEAARLKELLKLDDISCDVLKVPHHGRYTARLIDLAARCGAKYAVITSSSAEPEDDETVSTLESAGTKVYLTREGTVTFAFTEDGVTASR